MAGARHLRLGRDIGYQRRQPFGGQVQPVRGKTGDIPRQIKGGRIEPAGLGKHRRAPGHGREHPLMAAGDEAVIDVQGF